MTNQSSQIRVSTSAKATLLIVATLIVYAPVVITTFVWDDVAVFQSAVFKNNGLYRIWIAGEDSNYWPIPWTMYRIESLLWGGNPLGYHIVNVVLHLVCSLLLWRVLAQLRIPGAWSASLLFAIHPVNVETAAWVIQRKTLLSMLFFLYAFRLYRRSFEKPSAGRYWLAVAMFLAAMLSKGAAIGLPLVLLLTHWLCEGRVTKDDLWRSIPFFLIAIGMSFVEIHFQLNESIGPTKIRSDGLWGRTLGAAYAVWFYLGKLLVPYHLNFCYARWTIDPASFRWHVPLLAFALVAMICRWKWSSFGKPLLIAGLYYVLMLGPMLGFVNIYYFRFSYVADHYQYLAVPGVASAIAAGFSYLCSRVRFQVARALVAIGTVVCLALGAISWEQIFVYRNHVTMWSDVLSKNPNSWSSFNNLGSLANAANRKSDAMRYFDKALECDPDADLANFHKGLLIAQQGREKESIPYFERALRNSPPDERMHLALGSAYHSLGQKERALAEWRRAYELTPDNPDAVEKLGGFLLEEQHFDEALPIFSRAIEEAPESYMVNLGLGQALIGLSRYTEAVDPLRQAVKIDPDQPSGYYFLGLALLEAKQTGEAERVLRKGLQISSFGSQADVEIRRLLLRINN